MHQNSFSLNDLERQFVEVHNAQRRADNGKIITSHGMLNAYFKTCIPFFIEIDLCLTDREQKISWHFSRHDVHATFHEIRVKSYPVDYMHRKQLKQHHVPDNHKVEFPACLPYIGNTVLRRMCMETNNSPHFRVHL